MYLPDDIDLPKVPKQWLVNVIAAVVGTALFGVRSRRAREPCELRCVCHRMSGPADEYRAVQLPACGLLHESSGHERLKAYVCNCMPPQVLHCWSYGQGR